MWNTQDLQIAGFSREPPSPSLHQGSEFVQASENTEETHGYLVDTTSACEMRCFVESLCDAIFFVQVFTRLANHKATLMQLCQPSGAASPGPYQGDRSAPLYDIDRQIAVR